MGLSVQTTATALLGGTVPRMNAPQENAQALGDAPAMFSARKTMIALKETTVLTGGIVPGIPIVQRAETVP
jgi:hypothetical protein